MLSTYYALCCPFQLSAKALVGMAKRQRLSYDETTKYVLSVNFFTDGATIISVNC